MSGSDRLHAFDAAIALAPQGEGAWHGHTSAAYANMIGPFGGVMAAQALNAVLQHPQRLGHPVAFTVNFAAALADGPFMVLARPARTNRSTQHWIVEIRQQEQTVLTATGVTAVRRETWGATDLPMPAPRQSSMKGFTSLPRSPMRAITLISAFDPLAISPSSVLLPTPLPEKMPTR